MRTHRTAWLMSRFPAVSETFILQEISEACRQGVAATIYPLVRQRESVQHPEVNNLLSRVRYVRPFDPRVIAAQVYWARKAPGAYFRAWRDALFGNLSSPRFLLRACAVVPAGAWFARAMDAEGVEHQHAHWATHPALAALIVKRLTDIPYSFTAHAHDIYVDRTMLEVKLREARFVVTISEFNRRLLESHYPGLLGDRLHVVRCGIDLNAFPVWTPPRGFPSRILCVAGLRDYKGHQHLIRAFAALTSAGRDLRLELVGDGPLRRSLTDLVGKFGLSDRVVFHGSLPAPKVAEAMERCHLFVLPSVITEKGKMEGLPVALMEAMARGMPVIASDLSAIPELVEDGITGLLVPPGDPEALAAAISMCLDDLEGARQRASKGAERVRRDHDIVTNTRRLLDLIDEYSPRGDGRESR